MQGEEGLTRGRSGRASSACHTYYHDDSWCLASIKALYGHRPSGTGLGFTSWPCDVPHAVCIHPSRYCLHHLLTHTVSFNPHPVTRPHRANGATRSSSRGGKQRRRRGHSHQQWHGPIGGSDSRVLEAGGRGPGLGPVKPTAGSGVPWG